MQQHMQRSGLIIGLLSIGLLAGAALTAHPAQAVDAVGPYYAEPAWDQSLPAATRFVVLTNWSSKAVLDKETGLVWERSPVFTLQIWIGAKNLCTELETGNRKGWRLPSVHELASLIDPSVASPGPALPLGHPFVGVIAGAYWSATTDADDPSSAWFVNFANGFMSVGLKQQDPPVPFSAWCVRGGMNADVY